jgi:probable selenate reductase FAD-binding subunit
MLPNVTAYHKPTSVEEALRLLQRRNGRAVLLAGGTEVLTRRDSGVQTVIDLSGLKLDYISPGKDSLEIGAMTTLQNLVESPLLAEYAGGLLVTAAHDTATRTVRNAATVGGSIVSSAAANDLVVALLALDATIVSASGDSMCLEDALSSGALRDKVKLLLGVRLPLNTSGWCTASCRVARLPSDQAIVNVAVALRCEQGVCKDVRLAAGGVAMRPLRLGRAERLLRGTRLTDADLTKAIAVQQREIAPPSDTLGSGAYRSAMLGVLLRRAVRRCQDGEGER